MRLFGTTIATPEPPVWSIFDEQDTTLGQLVNYANVRKTHGDLADYMEVLFSPEELGTPLNEGFRGHPSIGALVMSNTDQGSDPWRTFWEDVERSNRPNDVRVFLVGSIFGGTGAAGVPTFGAREMLKFNRRASLNAERGLSRVLLGGALVLPYFSIALDGDAAARAEGQMFVTNQDFPVATKAALQYYHEKDLAFDQLYFIGDSLAQEVGSFSPGSKTQENRAHYIELVSALAALDFFRQPEPKEPERRYFAAARDTAVVDWKALPVTRDAERRDDLQSEVKLRLVTMTAFAYALATHGREVLDMPHDQVLEAWYNHHFSFRRGRSEDLGKDPRSQKHREVIEAVTDYAERFLRWMAAMDDPRDHRVRLIDRAKLLAGGQPDGDLLPYREHAANIGRLLHDGTGDRGFDQFRNELDGVTVSDPSMPAADRFLNLFYEAALRFTVGNYRIHHAPPAPSPGR